MATPRYPAPSTNSSITLATTIATTDSSLSTQKFQFPRNYSFPPFFDLQPNLTTRSAQLATWSQFIQDYCRYHRIFCLSLIDALNTPLFNNEKMRRRLSLRHATTILSWMATPEGGNRAEFISTGANKKAARADEEGGEGGKVWIYWRKPEEWAVALEEWVERTGQRGTVLTLYEIVEGDASRREEFYGMDSELLQKSLGVCVKRGKAQIFGSEGSEGVKFF